MGTMVKVGMADLNVCTPPDAITTLGLGSCVGVVLYDPNKKICGMVHIMLPDSTKIKNNENLAKFADTGIDELIRRLVAIGASKSALVAKIAGGAQMFAFSSNNDMLRVGDRNVEATTNKLLSLRIPIIASDTGLNYGRTIEFYPETGELVIKAVGKEIKKI
ncbi:MAG: chemotaxis protein CheD [Clostridiales bacterium]|nr:chemotaxis protein CheD [Clostridiales bacterium]